jgi:hypothetical protein
MSQACRRAGASAMPLAGTCAGAGVRPLGQACLLVQRARPSGCCWHPARGAPPQGASAQGHGSTAARSWAARSSSGPNTGPLRGGRRRHGARGTGRAAGRSTLTAPRAGASGRPRARRPAPRPHSARPGRARARRRARPAPPAARRPPAPRGSPALGLLSALQSRARARRRRSCSGSRANCAQQQKAAAELWPGHLTKLRKICRC